MNSSLTKISDAAAHVKSFRRIEDTKPPNLRGKVHRGLSPRGFPREPSCRLWFMLFEMSPPPKVAVSLTLTPRECTFRSQPLGISRFTQHQHSRVNAGDSLGRKKMNKKLCGIFAVV